MFIYFAGVLILRWFFLEGGGVHVELCVVYDLFTSKYRSHDYETLSGKKVSVMI